MKKLVFIVCYCIITSSLKSQNTGNKDSIFLSVLAHDAKLIVAKYNTKRAVGGTEKSFVSLMKQAAKASSWTSKEKFIYQGGISQLSIILGLQANPDEGGEIADKKPVNIGDNANPDEGGEVFLNGLPATYIIYKKIFQHFKATNNISNNQKLKIVSR